MKTRRVAVMASILAYLAYLAILGVNCTATRYGPARTPEFAEASYRPIPLMDSTPDSCLPPGDYVITLTATNATGLDTKEASFRIVTDLYIFADGFETGGLHNWSTVSPIRNDAKGAQESPDIFETDPGMGRPCDGDSGDWNPWCQGEVGEWLFIVGEGWVFQPFDARNEKEP